MNSKKGGSVFYRVIRITVTVTGMTVYDSLEKVLGGSVDRDYRFFDSQITPYLQD